MVTATAAMASAPADRYFGRLKMSTLRIRYETLQIEKRYWAHQLLPNQALHLLLLTEDAFKQWAGAYPHDPWLASTGYNMAQVYEQLPRTTARTHAVALLSYVKSHFAETSFARESRDQLHRGVRVRPEAAWTAAPSPATLSPTPSPTP